MALLVGTNSWVTVAEADDYLEDNMNAEDWFNLPSSSGSQKGIQSRASVLVTAFRWLMSHPDLTGLSASLTDENVKEAQIESALFLLRYQQEYEKNSALIAMGIESIEVGQWTQDFAGIGKGGGAVKLPANIAGLLDAYGNWGGKVVQVYGDSYTDG